MTISKVSSLAGLSFGLLALGFSLVLRAQGVGSPQSPSGMQGVPPNGGAPTTMVPLSQAPPLETDFGSNLPTFKYEPAGKRDPFRPYRISAGARKQDDKSGVDALQRYELDRYEVIGVMWEVKKPRAVLKDPDGGTHTVYVNTKIGRNRGVITDIKEGQLLVTEKIDIEGGMKEEFHVLDIRK